MNYEHSEPGKWLKAQNTSLDTERKKYEALLASILELLDSQDESVHSLVRFGLTQIDSELSQNDQPQDQPEYTDHFEELWRSVRTDQSSFLPGFLEKGL